MFSRCSVEVDVRIGQERIQSVTESPLTRQETDRERVRLAVPVNCHEAEAHLLNGVLDVTRSVPVRLEPVAHGVRRGMAAVTRGREDFLE